MTVCKTPVNCIDRRDCVERDCDNFSELLRQRLVSGTFSGCAFVFAGDRKEKTDPCGAGGKLSGDHGFILSAVYKDGNESAGRRRNLLPDFVAASHGGCDRLCGDPVVWKALPDRLCCFGAGAGADRKVGVQQPVSVKGAEPVSYSKFRDCDLQRDHAGGGGRARLGGISAGADLLCAAVYLGGADAVRAGNAGGVLGVELGHASDL